MKNIYPLVCLLFISIAALGQNQLSYNLQPGTYVPGKVIFKLLPENRPALVKKETHSKAYQLTDATLQNICATQGQFSVKALFPQHWGKVAAGKVDLSLIGELEFDEAVNVPALCRQLMSTGQFHGMSMISSIARYL